VVLCFEHERNKKKEERNRKRERGKAPWFRSNPSKHVCSKWGIVIMLMLDGCRRIEQRKEDEFGDPERPGVYRIHAAKPANRTPSSFRAASSL
jgi:hypothetical protein